MVLGHHPPGGRAAPAQPVHRQRPLPRQAAACAVRNGLDLSTNRLPEGAEYLHLDRFRERLQRARVAVAAWPEEERRHAEIILDIYEQEDMDILFAWRRSLANPTSPVWALLEALQLPR
jgi:hypothetical protein